MNYSFNSLNVKNLSFEEIYIMFNHIFIHIQYHI